MSELKIKGKLTSILPLESGTSKTGKEWKKQQFIVQTDEQYNNIYCFAIMNINADKFRDKYTVGDQVTVNFNVNTNEWQGRFFTELRAWKVDKDEPPQMQQPANPVPYPTREAAPEHSDGDLPF